MVHFVSGIGRHEMRKDPLKTDFLYHICTKSIAGYRIFRTDDDYSRVMEMLLYYSIDKPPVKFSLYQKLVSSGNFDVTSELIKKDKLIDIIAYCIMPTHLHLVLIQLKENGITLFMKNILDSYSRYFNIKNNRKGPLWQGRFKSILIETDEQLLHLTRYIHLNPTSDNLVDNPLNWNYSSYKEYLNLTDDSLCNFQPYLSINPETYKAFVEDRQDYQRRLSEIKHLLLD